MAIKGQRRPPPERIELDGDTLLKDELWCDEVLGGATRRTAQRLDAEGCPYVVVRGYKYRPLNAGRAWLAGRIQQHNQPRNRKVA
jgi:hypothetical protein